MRGLRNEGFDVTWTVESGDSVSVEETGPEPECPPVLVVAGATTAVSLAVPRATAEWPGCVVFLRRLRDGVDELAELLAVRAAIPGGSERDGDRG